MPERAISRSEADGKLIVAGRWRQAAEFRSIRSRDVHGNAFGPNLPIEAWPARQAPADQIPTGSRRRRLRHDYFSSDVEG